MFEITIRVESPRGASELVDLIVRSEAYEEVDRLRIARIAQALAQERGALEAAAPPRGEPFQ